MMACIALDVFTGTRAKIPQGFSRITLYAAKNNFKEDCSIHLF